MGFSIEDEMAEFFEGDSPDYSLELDDLHRGDMVFLANGVVLSAIQSKQMGEPRVAERKMALAEKVTSPTLRSRLGWPLSSAS